MKKRTTALARVAAFTALVAAFLVVIVVVSSSLSGGGGSGRERTSDQASKHRANLHVPASYRVKNGDTLTSIAHKVGVSVVRIETLNPGVDPQILVSGEKLKLR